MANSTILFSTTHFQFFSKARTLVHNVFGIEIYAIPTQVTDTLFSYSIRTDAKLTKIRQHRLEAYIAGVIDGLESGI